MKVVTEEEAQNAKEEAETKASEEDEAESTEAKPEASSSTTDTSAADKAAADKAAADKAAADQAALAAQVAAAAAASPYVWTYQGVGFTQPEVDLFHSLWDYTGDYDEYVTHHTAGELESLCRAKGLRQ